MANLFESASNTSQNPSVTSIYKKNKSIVSLAFETSTTDPIFGLVRPIHSSASRSHLLRGSRL